MDKKRLHIISHSFPNSYAPYDATFVHDHIKALSQSFDIRVTVPTPLSIPFSRRYKKNHSQLILPIDSHGNRCYYLSLPKKKLPSVIKWSLARNVFKKLTNQSTDLIHIHFLYPSGMIIPELKKKQQCPLILTIHGVDFYHTIKKPSLRGPLGRALDQVDTIIAVGSELKNDIITDFPHLKNKTKCIHNFVDTETFHPSDPDIKQQLKRQLGLKKSTFQLLCVANFRHKKGIDTIIKALSLIDTGDRPDFHLIGRINEEPAFEADVRLYIHNEGLKNVYIHGPKPRKEIKKWMQAVDGFALPSRKEPFGISLIEAMSSGLPVVTTKSGGPEEILNGKWGSLVDPDNPEQLADAIFKMAQLGSFDTEGQHRYVEEMFGKKRYVKEYTELYEALLSS